jgi:hypothetical protein
MNKRLVAVLIFSLTALIICSCVDSGSFKNIKTETYSFSYPNSFTKTKSEEQIELTLIEKNRNDDNSIVFKSNVTLVVLQGPTEIRANDLDLSEIEQNSTQLETKIIGNNRMPVLELKYDQKINSDLLIKVYQRIYSTKEQTYILTFTSLPEQFELYNKEIIESFDTFKILD